MASSKFLNYFSVNIFDFFFPFFRKKLYIHFLFVIYLVFLIVLLPFVSFFYDSDTENTCCVRFFKSLVYTVLLTVIVIILGLIAWGIVNNTTIKYSQKVAYISALQYKDEVTTSAIIEKNNVSEKDFPYQPNILLTAVIFILFIGWFIFIIFGGIGMIALPMDLIIDYIYR